MSVPAPRREVPPILLPSPARRARPGGGEVGRRGGRGRREEGVARAPARSAAEERQLVAVAVSEMGERSEHGNMATCTGGALLKSASLWRELCRHSLKCIKREGWVRGVRMREGGPISYEATPSPSFHASPPPPGSLACGHALKCVSVGGEREGWVRGVSMRTWQHVLMLKSASLLR